MTHTKAKNIISAFKSYQNSAMHTIFDAYGSPSENKVCAYYGCLHDCVQNDGYDFRIIGANSNTFSCGYCYMDGDREVFVWITKDNTRFVYLDEIDG